MPEGTTSIRLAGIPSRTRTLLTPSEMAITASMLWVYFFADLIGKSTRLDTIRSGTLAIWAAADPTASPWASWKWARTHLPRRIRAASRTTDHRSASLRIRSGRTSRPAAAAFSWSGLSGWTTKTAGHPLASSSRPRRSAWRWPPRHSRPASIWKRLNPLSFFPDLAELGVAQEDRAAVQEGDDQPRKAVQDAEPQDVGLEETGRRQDGEMDEAASLSPGRRASARPGRRTG
jgi:hypothetical protein